ncbi:TPA: hypothetical protein DCR79_01150 [Patescibacteria group bacterium]|nr:hypothetical protein [Patescibacteria group bacterium]
MNDLYAVIFAGGAGGRLWPVSRRNSPKQLNPFLDNADTLLQRTWQRMRKLLPPEQIYISTVRGYENIISSQLPEFLLNNLIIEPTLRDTTAAIGLATTVIARRHPGAFMMNVWSDHVYADEEKFVAVIKQLYQSLQQQPDIIMSVGVPIAYPYTGYGYLEVEATPISEQMFQVKRFVEKPNLTDAEKYMQSGNYYWNPALWMWQVEHMLQLYQQYVPDMHAGLMQIQNLVDTPDYSKTVQTIYPTFTKVAVDYAIFEKGPTMRLIPAELGWRDVGSWQSVYEVLNGKSASASVATKGQALTLDCENVLVFNEDNKKLVTVVGLEDVAVINTPDAVLVVKKSQDQAVKKLIAKLEKEEMTEYL